MTPGAQPTTSSLPVSELAGESAFEPLDEQSGAAEAGEPAATNGSPGGADSLTGSNEDVFARAVGLAEAPAKARRGRRRRANTSRPVVTAEDAARLADQASAIAAAQDRRVVPGDPVAEPLAVKRPEGWLQRRRSRVRRTRRTIRHIDPWSVFKVSILLYICLYIAVMIAGVLLWSAAVNSGVIDNVESFVEEVGSYQVWQLDGDEIFRRSAVIGIVLMVFGVAFNVFMAIVFNLISDLVGGVRVTILEEDTASRTSG
jgi:hypothetical protein